MNHMMPHLGDKVQPGGYAVLGAASMAAGVTRTISSAILIFELTGGLQHVLPILIAVVIAFIVGQCYSVRQPGDGVMDGMGGISRRDWDSSVGIAGCAGGRG